MAKREDILKKVESSVDRFLKRMEDTLPEYLYGERFQKNVRKAVDSAMDRIGAVTRDDLDEFADKMLDRLEKVIGPERASALRERIPKKKEIISTSVKKEPEDIKKEPARPKRGRKPAAKKRTCSVRGCDKPHRSKGYCAKHYSQWRRGRLQG